MAALPYLLEFCSDGHPSALALVHLTDQDHAIATAFARTITARENPDGAALYIHNADTGTPDDYDHQDAHTGTQWAIVE